MSTVQTNLPNFREADLNSPDYILAVAESFGFSPEVVSREIEELGIADVRHYLKCMLEVKTHNRSVH